MTTPDPLPCGFKFDSGMPCLAGRSHPVHRGRWAGPEPNHRFQPMDRRKAERRAALTDPTP